MKTRTLENKNGMPIFAMNLAPIYQIHKQD